MQGATGASPQPRELPTIERLIIEVDQALHQAEEHIGRIEGARSRLVNPEPTPVERTAGEVGRTVNAATVESHLRSLIDRAHGLSIRLNHLANVFDKAI